MRRLKVYNKFYRRYEVDLWGRAGFQRVNKTVRFLKKIQREKIKYSVNPGRSFIVKKKKNVITQSKRPRIVLSKKKISLQDLFGLSTSRSKNTINNLVFSKSFLLERKIKNISCLLSKFAILNSNPLKNPFYNSIASLTMKKKKIKALISNINSNTKIRVEIKKKLKAKLFKLLFNFTFLCILSRRKRQLKLKSINSAVTNSIILNNLKLSNENKNN